MASRKYRVKIETQKNGVVWFVPQTKQSGWFGGWQSIDDDGFIGAGSHFKEKGALKAIEKHKRRMEKNKLKEVKKIEYKNL